MRLEYDHRKITMTLTQTTCPKRITLPASNKRACSAGVGVLATVFKKSVIELKHYQNLLQCKSTMQIVAFNVRSLNRNSQQPKLTASVVEHNIDIVCVQ